MGDSPEEMIEDSPEDRCSACNGGFSAGHWWGRPQHLRKEPDSLVGLAHQVCLGSLALSVSSLYISLCSLEFRVSAMWTHWHLTLFATLSLTPESIVPLPESDLPTHTSVSQDSAEICHLLQDSSALLRGSCLSV